MGKCPVCPSANLEENQSCFDYSTNEWRFFGFLAAIHYKELSPTLTRRLRGMGLTAKGAFALIAFFKSLRACLRAIFWQALVVRLLLGPLVHFLSEADKAEVDDEKNKEFDIASEQQKGTKPLVSVSWRFSAFAGPSWSLCKAKPRKCN